MQGYRYDCCVLGGGAAGLTAAKFARGLGKKVVIIEADKLGGMCTWTGCVPSKALIKTAAIAYHCSVLERYGLALPDAHVTTSDVFKHVRSCIHRIAQTHTADELKKLGIDVIHGSASFVDAHTLSVNGDHITADKIIIATGSSPKIPPINGLDKIPYLTNQTIFNLDIIPESMIIIGGGPIGIELGCALQRLGCSVTILEANERILVHDDHELADMLTTHLRKQGITIITHMRVTYVERNDLITVVALDSHGNEHEYQAEHLLVAVGRQPNIDTLMLSNAGIASHENGIVVDSTLQTTTSSVYACGDVVGPYLFSHMAWQQAVIATRNAFIPFFKQHISYEHVVWVTFCTPELATAGLTEEQARERYGDTLKIYYQEYSDCDRGRIDMIDFGLGKFICDSKGRLVGAHILGPRAGELIHEIQAANYFGTCFADLFKVTHAYPTYSELIWLAAKQAYLYQLQSSWVIRALHTILKRPAA